MTTFARRLAFAVISLAAAGIADWSLYVVANEIYSVPAALAVVVSAVFDGAAVYCLNLASQATREGRSAAGPRIATLALAAVSVYLNVVHATHIHGGLPAALLFAAPTVALLIVSDLSWAALRAKTRADRGEKPMTLPVFGAWGWLLARDKAWEATKAKAESHVTGQTSPQEASPEPQPERPVKSRRASDVLREQFAEMDPAEAIRITHEAHPELTPAELASLLIGYGVIVDAVQVVLVLGRAAPQVTLERDDATGPQRTPQHVAQHVAPQVEAPDGTQPALTANAANISKAAAIVEAAADLGPKPKPAEIVTLVRERHQLDVEPNFVRAVLSREAKKPKSRDSMEGGYA